MIYRGRNFTLDTRAYRLERDGGIQAVEPQVFDLLAYLIENRSRVVPREELLDKLWKGRIVSDNALNGRLKAARKAVGDSGKRQEVIRTFNRRGYQFIATIETEAENASNRPPRGASREGNARMPALAVLPFAPGQPTGDEAKLAIYLTDQLITDLCHYREMLVIAHDSVYACVDSGIDFSRAAAELGVHYLVKGSIGRSRGRYRVAVQLTDTRQGKVMWGHQVECDPKDIFAFEDEVTARVAMSLVGNIRVELARNAARKRPENMTAYDFLMRARRSLKSYQARHNLGARHLLEQAISLHPDYAHAHALLACSYCTEAESPLGRPRQVAIELAEKFAQKAVALDKFDCDAHSALAWAYRLQGKFELAELHCDRAIDCNPNDYGAFCGKTWLLAICGRADEAIDCANAALRLNPLAPDDCLLAIMLTEYLAGHYDGALKTARRIKAPNAYSEAIRTACLAQLGCDREARLAAASTLQLGGEFIRSGWAELWNFPNPRDHEHFFSGLRIAGVSVDRA